MSQQQQRILMRSGLAMGVTLALGMLAFGHVAGGARPATSSSVAAVEGVAPASQATGIGVAEAGAVAVDGAPPTVVATEASALQPQEFSRVARSADEDDDDHDISREASRRSERRDDR